VDAKVGLRAQTALYELLATTAHAEQLTVRASARPFSLDDVGNVMSVLTDFDAVCVAGGGTTIALAGFVAALHDFGRPLLVAATTTTAAIDAAVSARHRLLAGDRLGPACRKVPIRVLVDLNLLASQPLAAAQDGATEALKLALVDQRFMLDDDTLLALARGQMSSKAAFGIEQAVLVKMALIEDDPLEAGTGSVLQYGHEFARELEYASRWDISHGKAVRVGMIFSNCLSSAMGLMSESDAALLQRRVRMCGPVDVNLAPFREAGDAITGRLHPGAFVLLASAGVLIEPMGVIAVPRMVIEQALGTCEAVIS
jgi:3-dehydroquinate synthetase